MNENQNMPIGTRIAPSMAGISRNSGFFISSAWSLPFMTQFVRTLTIGGEISMPSSPIPKPMKERPTNWSGKPWLFINTRGKASKKR